MIKKFRDIISKYELINQNEHILVGLSGGADSVCLLSLLTAIKDEYNLVISAAHLNHGVRGEEANRDEEFSKRISEKHGIKFISKVADMNGYAKEMGLSKEAAGRVLRREFLFESKNILGADKIALAHNQDDQAETILMRILRGTGVDGLSGIFEKSGCIIRPLLYFTREEIESFLSDMGIEYVDDSTNFENIYHRNKIRNVLLPMLREYNPKINSALLNLSTIARVDSDFLNMYTDKVLHELSDISDQKIVIDDNAFNEQHEAIKNRIIRNVFVKINGELVDLSYENIVDIIGLFKGETGKIIENINGISIRKSYNKLIFEKNVNHLKNDFYKVLKVGINNVNDVYSILFEYTELMPNREENAILIPEELIVGDLVARSRAASDKIRPLGLNGSKKVKDIFIDKKVDRELRNIIPIVTDEKQIFWVSGLVKADVTNLKSSNNRYVKLTLIKNNPEEKNA